MKYSVFWTLLILLVACKSDIPVPMDNHTKNFTIRSILDGGTGVIWPESIITLPHLDSFRKTVSSLKALRTNINKLPYWLAKDIRNNKIKLHVIYQPSSLIPEQKLRETIQTETAIGKTDIDLIPTDTLTFDYSYELYYTHLKQLSPKQQATKDLLSYIATCTSDRAVLQWYEQLPVTIKENLKKDEYRLYLTDPKDYTKKTEKVRGVSYALSFHVANLIGNTYLDYPNLQIVSFIDNTKEKEKVNSNHYPTAIQLIIAPNYLNKSPEYKNKMAN